MKLAISCYRAAFQVYTYQTLPSDWAMVHSNLGVAYATLEDGDRHTNAEKAITSQKAALTVYTQQAFPDKWAMTQLKLGMAYAMSADEVHWENKEEAIACFKAVLLGGMYQPYWGIALFDLNSSYQGLSEDEQANMKRAIADYQEILQAYPPQDFPLERAVIQLHLGSAYNKLRFGNREANLKNALECFKNASDVFKLMHMEDDLRSVDEEITQIQNELKSLRE